MKKVTTFLKVALAVMMLVVIGLCAGAVELANRTAEMYPEYAYLKFPVLIGLYLPVIPFGYALYQAFELLRKIERENAFSGPSVNALRHIKYCAVAISAIYFIGSVLLFFQNALHPGIAILCFSIIFASAVVAVFAAVLQELLRSALQLKSENELTI